MNTRNGKIARLPKAIREQLNQQLEEGVPARSLVAWLNGLPKVRAVLKAHFAGTEIREQNLSEWKKGGFQEWQRHQEAVALAERLYERAEEMKARARKEMPMSEVLSLWVAARYAAMTEEIEAMNGAEGRKELERMSKEVARLRRQDQWAQRIFQEAWKVDYQRQALVIEQERWEQEKRERQAEEEARHPRKLTPEERKRRIAEIYGMEHRYGAAANAATAAKGPGSTGAAGAKPAEAKPASAGPGSAAPTASGTSAAPATPAPGAATASSAGGTAAAS